MIRQTNKEIERLTDWDKNISMQFSYTKCSLTVTLNDICQTKNALPRGFENFSEIMSESRQTGSLRSFVYNDNFDSLQDRKLDILLKKLIIIVITIKKRKIS